ncbi:MAG: glycosyltransferase family 4 protein [Flavobacteriales bacterium]
MSKKRILFLTPYPINKAPSQRLKFEQYFHVFEESGFSVTTNSFVNEKFWQIIYKPGFLLQKIYFTFLGYFNRFKVFFCLYKFDIVYVHLWVTPVGFPFFEYLVSLLSKKLIYDIDDMIFLGHSSDANRLWQGLKGRQKMIFLMRKADQVITCTPKLDEFVRQYNNNTVDISSTVDTTNKYLPVNTYKNDHQIILGWSGSHSTSQYLYLIQDALKDLAKKYDYKLIVMGDASFQISGVNVDAFDWTEDLEIPTLQKFDIGLYPLPDKEWVYGKSGLKAIQYMALGIPTIATSIGANFRIIENERNGYLIQPDDIKGWKDKIEKLISSPEQRKLFGIAGRETIIEKYSLEANKEKYLKVFQ